MKTKQIIVLVAVVITVSVLVGSLVLPEEESSTTSLDTINPDLRAVKIGMILPLTGDFSSYGSESQKAALYGIEQFNKHLESTGQDWYWYLA